MLKGTIEFRNLYQSDNGQQRVSRMNGSKEQMLPDCIRAAFRCCALVHLNDPGVIWLDAIYAYKPFRNWR
jgi:hypothetical protein